MNRFQDTDEALAEWDQRNPRLAIDRLRDAGLHRQFHITRTVLSVVERAMIEEGVPQEARRRILNTAVFGGPDPDQVVTADQIRRDAERELTPWEIWGPGWTTGA